MASSCSEAMHGQLPKDVQQEGERLMEKRFVAFQPMDDVKQESSYVCMDVEKLQKSEDDPPQSDHAGPLFTWHRDFKQLSLKFVSEPSYPNCSGFMQLCHWLCNSQNSPMIVPLCPFVLLPCSIGNVVKVFQKM